MNIPELFINTVSGLGLPTIRQGSLAPDESYPPAFFTFWNSDSLDSGHYDNLPAGIVWDFDLNCYSTDPIQIYTLMDQAAAALRAQGFIISGRGYDVASDEVTHTGRGLNVLYNRNLKEDEDGDF